MRTSRTSWHRPELALPRDRKSAESSNQSAFARSSRADQRYGFARVRFERNVAQDGLALFIAKRDMLDLYQTPD